MSAYVVDPKIVALSRALPSPTLVQDAIQRGGNWTYSVILAHPLAWPIIVCERRPWHALPFLRWVKVGGK